VARIIESTEYQDCCNAMVCFLYVRTTTHSAATGHAANDRAQRTYCLGNRIGVDSANRRCHNDRKGRDPTSAACTWQMSHPDVTTGAIRS
jgi:hypothetical protein